MMRKTGLWGLLAILALPGLVSAQEATWSVQTNRGWIGLSVLYSTGVVEGVETTVVVIDGVVEGSPAEAAGVQVGDTLTHLDGQPISQSVLASLQRTIEAGDLVRLTIRRDGRARDVLVEAGQDRAQAWVLAPDAGQMAIRLNEVSGAIMESLDSLRVSISTIETDPEGNISIRVLPGVEDPEKSFRFDMQYRMWGEEWDSLHVSFPDFFVVEPESAVPFEAFVVSSEETQQLRNQIKGARNALTDARRQELRRVREIEAALPGGNIEEAVQADPRIQEIREREKALSEELTQLNRRLELVSQNLIQRRFAEIQARQEEALSQARRVREEESTRSRGTRAEVSRSRERVLQLQEEYERRSPLNYVIAGQSFVAGAELRPLNEDLAPYFQVDEGVLVTEVIEGTPAFEAGLLSGDVIVRVGGEKVASLKDLRFGIGYLERPLRLQIIRKGEPLQILIR